MAKASYMQNTFTGGEWAPSLYVRTRLEKFPTAVRQMRNFLIHPHGPASNRPGLRFVYECKHPDKAVRLIPFEFSVVQTYILEFGDYYMRVYRDGGIVLAGGSPYEIVTPYSEADLALLKYEQSADVLYLNHPNHAERQLTRSAHINWTLTQTDFGSTLDAPTNFIRNPDTGPADHTYAVTAVQDGGLESLISNSYAGGPGDTFEWDAVAEADYYNFYEEVNGSYGWLGYAGSNTYEVPDNLEPDMNATPPKLGDYFIGVDGDGLNKYPSVSSFFEQRLLRAGSDSKPQTIRGSVIGDFDNNNASSPLKDDDSYEFTINSDQVNAIRWMAPLRVLLIGTSGSIWQMSAGQGNAVTFNDVNLERQSVIGAENILPLVIGNSVLFIEYAGTKVRDLYYDLNTDGYVGSDLSILAPHFFEDYPIVDWAYQRHPNSIIWCVREDGALAGLTYYREHKVWGWHLHETDGQFESTACITTPDGTSDVYFVVRRVINGSEKRYIEVLSEGLPSTEIRDAFYVDSGLSLDDPKPILQITQVVTAVVSTTVAHGLSEGDLIDIDGTIEGMSEVKDKRFKVGTIISPQIFRLLDQTTGDPIDSSAYEAYISGGNVRKAVSTVSGLDHLEGEDVVALADGNVIRNLTVSGGSVSIAKPASRIHVGLPYESVMETMDFDFAIEGSNTLHDRIRNITSVIVRMEKSRSLWIGPDEDNLEEVPFRTNEAYSDPTRLYTGDREVLILSGDDREARVYIKIVDPSPTTITGLIARIDYGES